MSVAKAFARTITFLLDGLQGPTNREARESLERALADAELRREKEVRETEERRSSEVTGLGQQLAEVVAQRDEARKCFADAFARALDVKRILGAVPPEGSVSAAKRVVAERGEARGQLNEVRERAEAAEARLAALTAPVDGEPSEEALGLVWRQSVDARAESKDPFGGSQHQHRLALWRAGAAHERVRTAQLRAEVSEARADRDKAIAELEATNLRVAELESADALLDMSTPEHVVNAELRSIGVDPDALAERTLKFVGKVRDEVRIATDEELATIGFRAMNQAGQIPNHIANSFSDKTRHAGARAIAQHVRLERSAELAELRARIAELEAPTKPRATNRELDGLADERYRRVRRERPPCLIARAVAANIDVRVAEEQGGGFLVAAHRAGEDEDVERNVPAAEVPATLARMIGEVGA